MANHHELDDQQLIQLVAQAEKEALEALYSRYSSPVYSLAMYMLKHQALAEEVTQQGNGGPLAGVAIPGNRRTGRI